MTAPSWPPMRTRIGTWRQQLASRTRPTDIRRPRQTASFSGSVPTITVALIDYTIQRCRRWVDLLLPILRHPACYRDELRNDGGGLGRN